MNDELKRLRELLNKHKSAVAALVAELPRGSEDGTYECPLCGGDGSFPGDQVASSDRLTEAGEGFNYAGLQVYGVGACVSELQELLPLLVKHAPMLLAALDQVEALNAPQA
jgi:hypothetical protein